MSEFERVKRPVHKGPPELIPGAAEAIVGTMTTGDAVRVVPNGVSIAVLRRRYMGAMRVRHLRLRSREVNGALLMWAVPMPETSKP